VLGVSGGETVALAAQMMPACAVENVSVVQLGSGVAFLGDRLTYSSAEVALQAAQKLGSMDRLMLIPIPPLFDNEAIRDALLCDTGVQQALALLASCTVALIGIGALEGGAQVSGLSPGSIGVVEPQDDANGATGVSESVAAGVRSWRSHRRPLQPVTADEVVKLRGAGAVGEICTRFFDIAGQPCATALDRRMVGLNLVQLRAVPLVVGVACGRQKAAAILGAVRGGYVKSLVTDDVTAAAVLALARARAAPPGGPGTDDGGVTGPAQANERRTSRPGDRVRAGAGERDVKQRLGQRERQRTAPRSRGAR
jgi:deoxyribonucleoside regulator